MHPETGGRNPPTSLSDGRKAGTQHGAAFAADTEKATGESKRRTNEHIARATALGPDLHAVVGTSLDKGVWGSSTNGKRTANRIAAPQTKTACIAASR